MNPERVRFAAPIEVPTMRDGQRGGFLDIVLSEDAQPQDLRWRSLEDWPLVVCVSTGQEGRLVRTVKHNVHTLPRSGLVTLTFELFIAVENGKKLFDEWDENDWKLQERSAVAARA